MPGRIGSPHRSPFSRREPSGTSRSHSTDSTNRPTIADTRDIRKMDEAFERSQLGGKNQPGKLLPLHQGAPHKGLAVSIHGINGNPQNMAPLSAGSIKENTTTQTYAYDDNFRRLTNTATDFANSLGSWLQDNPGKPLRVDAHSMGTRVTLAAMDQLAQRGLLQDRDVQLNLVAPPLAGFDSANAAKWAPPFLTFIKNVRPGKDMGSSSDFQKTLESIQLPANVKTHLFVGGRDDLVDANAPVFRELAARLNATVHTFPEATHDSVILSAQQWLENHSR